jgi:hypothetical protein
LLAGLAEVPGPARANAGQPNLLRGVTRFTATNTASTVIRVPQGVSLDDLRVSYEGGGRVKGLMMRKIGEYKQESFRPVYEDLTVGTCAKRGCKARRDVRRERCWNCSDKDLPGSWTLYVIADGAPLTVTLQIKGRSGQASIDVRGKATAQIKTLPVHVDATDGHYLYSAGSFTSLKRADYGLVAVWMVGDPHLVTAADACLYYGRQRYPDDVAWSPGCSLLADSYPITHQTPAGEASVTYTSSAYDNPKGLGAWYSTVATVQDHGAVAFWIDF